MKTMGIALFFLLTLTAAFSESTHVFLDGFVMTVGKGHDLAVAADETALAVAVPGGRKVTGKIFSDKSSDAQHIERVAQMKLLALNLFADKLKTPAGAGVKATVAAIPAGGNRAYRAYWVSVKGADQREYVALAVDLTPSPGLASIMLLRAETEQPAAQRAILAALLKNLALAFLPAAG